MAQGKAIDLGIYGDSTREQAQGLVSIVQDDTLSAADIARTIEAAPKAVRVMAKRLLCALGDTSIPE